MSCFDRVGIEVGGVIHPEWLQNILVDVILERRIQEHRWQIGKGGVHVVIILKNFPEARGWFEILQT
jgi:hypothetical protein